MAILNSKQRPAGEQGFTIIENLVAITLVSIALVGSTALFSSSYQHNATRRTYGALAADARLIIDAYRSNYNSLLDEFGVNYIDIANGQQATISQSSAQSRSLYTIVLTAQKTKADSIPEAVTVTIQAAQRRGKLADGQYTFETIIAQAG